MCVWETLPLVLWVTFILCLVDHQQLPELMMCVCGYYSLCDSNYMHVWVPNPKICFCWVQVILLALNKTAVWCSAVANIRWCNAGIFLCISIKKRWYKGVSLSGTRSNSGKFWIMFWKWTYQSEFDMVRAYKFEHAYFFPLDLSLLKCLNVFALDAKQQSKCHLLWSKIHKHCTSKWFAKRSLKC